jgi:hypothetical protein
MIDEIRCDCDYIGDQVPCWAEQLSSFTELGTGYIAANRAGGPSLLAHCIAGGFRTSE